jgi:hypothetical protein
LVKRAKVSQGLPTVDGSISSCLRTSAFVLCRTVGWRRGSNREGTGLCWG